MGVVNTFSHPGARKFKCRFIVAINPVGNPGNWTRTCFERLDGDGGRVVPQSLPDLSELAVTEASLELEATALDLPLVAGVVGKVSGGRLVNLENVVGSLKIRNLFP